MGGSTPFSLHALPRILSRGEVLPHHYGTHTDDPSQSTHTDDPSQRTAKSVLGEANTDGRADFATVESKRIGHAGVDRNEFRRRPGADFLRRTAARVLDILSAASAHRAGDCRRQGVGEQEAEVRRWRVFGASPPILVTGSSIETGCWELFSTGLLLASSSRYSSARGSTS